jgi:NAD-dependent SIR2 family protein deacetylase
LLLKTSIELLNKADNVIILAGAGISADIGTPTYWTGDEAKYANKESKYGFTSLEHSSAPLWQTHSGQQSDYFQALYAQMLNQQLPPDENNPYLLLKNWVTMNQKNYFVVTSNVDTAFSRNGFDTRQLYEMHGAYNRSQCLRKPLAHGVFSTVSPDLNKTLCPFCGGITRPNVLFFNDFWFNAKENEKQEDRLFEFEDSVLSQETVLLEVGVGLTVMNLRNMTRKLYAKYDIPLIRINPFHVMAGDHIATGKAPILEHKLKAIEGFKALFELN